LALRLTQLSHSNQAQSACFLLPTAMAYRAMRPGNLTCLAMVEHKKDAAIFQGMQ